jgi:uncharacterized protein YoxC
MTLVVVLVAITLVIVAVFLVRALLEIRETVVAARGLITRIDTELVPTVRELQQVLSSLQVTAEGVASRVEDVKSAMTAVGDTGRNISRINAVIGEIADFLGRTSLLCAGVKAAGRHVVERISRRRG